MLDGPALGYHDKNAWPNRLATRQRRPWPTWHFACIKVCGTPP
jgi:hypothetical protein